MELEKAIRQPRFESEHQKAVINVTYTAGWLNGMASRMLKPYGLTNPQFNVLRILRGQHPNPVTLGTITERMLDPASNATRLVEKLRQKGLVTRDLNPANRRQVDICITEKGLELLAELDQLLRERERQFHTLSEAEASELNRLLDKLRS